MHLNHRQACISIANVKAEGGWAEPWQTPEFDEWVLVTKGKVHIEHSHGPTVEVVAGKAVYLAKGERVRWVFPEGGAEYVPICLPGFTPDNVHREDPGVEPPVHDKHTDIYHMVRRSFCLLPLLPYTHLQNTRKCVCNRTQRTHVTLTPTTHETQYTRSSPGVGWRVAIVRVDLISSHRVSFISSSRHSSRSCPYCRGSDTQLGGGEGFRV